MLSVFLFSSRDRLTLRENRKKKKEMKNPSSVSVPCDRLYIKKKINNLCECSSYIQTGGSIFKLYHECNQTINR